MLLIFAHYALHLAVLHSVILASLTLCGWTDEFSTGYTLFEYHESWRCIVEPLLFAAASDHNYLRRESEVWKYKNWLFCKRQTWTCQVALHCEAEFNFFFKYFRLLLKKIHDRIQGGDDKVLQTRTEAISCFQLIPIPLLGTESVCLKDTSVLTPLSIFHRSGPEQPFTFLQPQVMKQVLWLSCVITETICSIISHQSVNNPLSSVFLSYHNIGWWTDMAQCCPSLMVSLQNCWIFSHFLFF